MGPLSRDDFRQLIADAIQGLDYDVKLMDTYDICNAMKIGRTHFEHYKRELLLSGMFQLDGKGSEYRMTRSDFQRYIDAKKNSHD